MKFLFRYIAIAIFITTFGVAIAQSQQALKVSSTDIPVETFSGSKKQSDNANTDRALRINLTVDDTTFLKVKEGQEVKKGDLLVENTLESDRLNKQRQSVVLQIENLKSKALPQPFEPKAAPAIANLPAANFLEEESNIAQAKLRLQQAQSTLESRRPFLLADNPEARAEVEKAEAGARSASEKVQEQEQLIKTMQDLRLDSPVLRHEEAKLKQAIAESEQANSAFDQAKGKLASSAIVQRQELEKLEVALQLAKSELNLAHSKLQTARDNRKLVEYRASIESAQRVEQQNEANLAYTRQLQEFAQQQRDRDYQLAQLQISLSSIDDKISLIPVVRSPKAGYIRRVKPWVGSNGKYSTTITISSSRPSSKNGASNRPTQTNAISDATSQGDTDE
ncbi:hypothetical protein [Nostoc cycadae]|uniref:Uncharacterized protein n=1 Tax=Nostoc cycadae WK-1 TaxID=1861711 RepID=A0A2H6LR17_9NOSO|nr:hypothetical protein [Nostoc cycadae]GBE95659.1 hypothetical protein NCWK1_5447 [Nostoc cycadae WK-1]